MELLREHREADLLRQMRLQIAGDAVDDAFLLRLRLRRGALGVERDFQIVDAGAEFLIVDRLEDVVRDLQPQRRAAVGKVVIPRDDHKRRLRVLDAAQLDDLQTVHDRDVDVHDDDVGPQRVDLRQRLHTVGGLAGHLAAVRLPVEQALEALADHDLIVHQQDAQFFHTSSSSAMGSSRCAVTPPVGFSVYERPYSRPQSSLIRFCTLSTPMLLPSNFGACFA